MKISIKTVINALESASDEYTIFFDANKNDIVYLMDNTISDEDSEELEYLIDNNPERFFRLPDKYEIHDYRIMENFIDTISDTKIKNHLLSAISGRGAFRYFKDAIFNYGLLQQCYNFKYNQYCYIAIKWCNDNNIDITE